MKEAILTRMPSEAKQTLGVLMSLNDGGFTCKSMELPWLANQNKTSCIPKGEYICKYTRSHRLSLEKGEDFYTYEIMNVPGRSGIRIHSCNYARQLLGCVGLGSGLKDLDMDGSLDITHSGDTIKAFEAFMKGQDFKLTIK